MRALAIVVLALAGCRDKPADKPLPPPKPGPASGADPWAGADASPDTPETRKARAEAAVARVKEIEPKVAKLRHLSLNNQIPAEYQTKDAFRGFVHAEVDKEKVQSANEQVALIQLGLLPAGVDLAKAEEQAFATQAAAYYDPAQKKFFTVQVPDAPAMLDVMTAHELTHGLQDQHFDLKRYMSEDASGKSQLDDDAQAARRFIVEGDATFTMFLYAMSDDGAPAPAMIKLLKGQLESLGDVDSMVDTMTAQAGLGSGDMADSMRAMKEIPKAILVPMIDSYMKGALVIADAYEMGGWPAVDALYANPPESTEQVLHPKEHLLGKNRDHPHKVTLPQLPGYEQVTTNVLGELMWQIYFSLWKHTGDDKVSVNWGGDRYALVRKGGKPVVLVATVWDTEYDAVQFAEAYTSTIAARVAAAGHNGKIAVRRAGARVFVVDGDDDPAVMDALVAGAKIDP